METILLQFVNEGLTLHVAPETTLLDVQIHAGLHTDAPCGGKGTCGKCLVDVCDIDGEEWREVLACQEIVRAPLKVRTRAASGSLRVLTEGTSDGGTWLPWASKIPLRVPPCAVGDCTADWERFLAALRKESGIEEWEADVTLISRLGTLIRETKGALFAIVERGRVLDISAEDKPVYMAAFDLGTTSIAGYLLYADNKEVAATGGLLNPQAKYGADVILRADYAIKNGVETLASCATDAIDSLLGTLAAQAGISRDDIYALSVVGNTCMHHLFLGISPDSLAHAPYNPAVSGAMRLRASAHGLHIHPNGTLLMPPVIAGFVGADTVACLLAMDWEQRKEMTLLIDIGTNGEIVLGNCERMIACSTAAGPALEGAKIQCGMRGADGAVDHVTLENGALSYHVIGGGEPKGICGSGLIDLIAVLRRMDIIDDGGKLLCGSEYRLGESEVVLTQKDIREVQLAKGAISAGIRLLAKQRGITLADIKTVCIAGAFGSYMNAESACDIGLIPAELRGKITAIGNAAGEGAKCVLRNREDWTRAQKLAAQSEFLELATLAEFQDEFVDGLEFPELEELSC